MVLTCIRWKEKMGTIISVFVFFWQLPIFCGRSNNLVCNSMNFSNNKPKNNFTCSVLRKSTNDNVYHVQKQLALEVFFWFISLKPSYTIRSTCILPIMSNSLNGIVPDVQLSSVVHLISTFNQQSPGSASHRRAC